MFTAKPKQEVKIKLEELPHLAKEMSKPAHIAWYYGFTPVKPPEITEEDITKAKHLKEVHAPNPENISSSQKELRLEAERVEEKIALLRSYFEFGLNSLPQPIMISYEKPFRGSLLKKLPKEREFGLEIIGTSRSIAEAVLIKTALAILEEDGQTDIFVELNSIGDKDSIARFERELVSFFKKNANNLSRELKQAFKKDIFEIQRCQTEKCKVFKENAPKSISFLSEPSRVHFAEVLEFLEALEIPYKINNDLVGNRNYCTQTIFEIRRSLGEDGKSILLASGARYNQLSKKLGFKKEIAGVGLSFCYKPEKEASDRKIELKKMPRHRFFFIQLGFEAKLQSLRVIESLRRAKVSVCHSLMKDKCMGQISSAENMQMPFVIIMGQKEAIERSVIVRDMSTREQETVPIADLPKFIKKWSKGFV